MQIFDDTGTVRIEDDVATLIFVRRLAHPIERVWQAITDPEHRARWFGQTTIEPRAGGMIETDPDDPPVPTSAKHMSGRIVVWDPPHVLGHEWHQAIVSASMVRYELVSDGDGTVLTFSHSGLKPHDARGFVPGTHAYLDRLTAHLDGTVIPAWSARYAAVAPRYI